MLSFPRPLALVFMLLVLAAPPATASGALNLRKILEERLDPTLDYQTIETPHFEIHFPTGLEAVATRVAGLSERVHEKVSGALQWQPQGKTHIVVVHRTDQPLIYTSVHPLRLIFFDVSLPQPSIGLNDFADWHEWLLTHEYSHIIHLDMREGVYAWLAPVFGSWVRPNLTNPPWFKEGLAVYLETALTPRGRGEGSVYRMMVRAATADGLLDSPAFATQDTINSFVPRTWPWTFRPYLVGYYLVRSLAKRGGLVQVAKASSGAFPYALESTFKQAGYDSLDALWADTLRQMREESEAELSRIRASPLTELEHLTDTGFLYHGLAMAPNGRWLLATREDPQSENAIVRLTLDGDRVQGPENLLLRTTGSQTSFSSTSRFVAFDQSGTDPRYYEVSDVFVYDLKTGEVVTTSPYLRGRDPEVLPDGKHLVFVANIAGKNQLVMADTGWGESKDLLGDVGYRRISSPRASPDGQSMVMAVTNERTGGEDLWRVGPEGVEVLVADGSRNSAPAWTPDGKMLLFSSDRSGVFNIYGLELESRRLHRLTNVVGGLFFPVVDPSSKWVYVASYRGKGYDLARFRWAPESWTLVEGEPGARVPVEEASAVAAEVSPPVELPKARPYQGGRYLLPQYLGPSVILRPDTFQVGVQLGAQDPLHFHSYNLDLRYDSATRLPVGTFAYYNGVLPWSFDLSLAHDAIKVPSTQRTWRSFGGAWSWNIPLSPSGTQVYLRPGLLGQTLHHEERTRLLGASLALRYSTEFHQIGQVFDESGTYLEVGARQYVRVDGHQPEPVLAAQLAMRTHLPLWWPSHVLHFGLEGAALLYGAEDQSSFIYAGGAQHGGGLQYLGEVHHIRDGHEYGSNPDVSMYSVGGPYTLFGYAPNAFVSRGLVIGSARYTFGLVDIDRGLSTVPLFLGRLSGSLRAQLAAVDLSRPAALPWSVGAELHQHMELGFVFRASLVLGLYRGDPRYDGRTQFMVSFTAN